MAAYKEIVAKSIIGKGKKAVFRSQGGVLPIPIFGSFVFKASGFGGKDSANGTLPGMLAHDKRGEKTVWAGDFALL